MPDAIRAAGGAIFAITSEPQSLASEAEAGWGFGFGSVGDPHHEILGACRDRGWLNLFVNAATEHLLKTRSWGAHPKGYFQPGVLALTREGRVLYRWRSRPTRRNVGGAIQRPTAQHVWQQVQTRLDGPAEDAPHDDTPVLDTKAPPWVLFLLLLLAHGWFLRPKPFPLGRPDDPQSSEPFKVIPRLLAFVAAWVAAFVYLPTGWVLLALAAWGVIVWPGLRIIHREFQNVPTGEPEAV